MQSSARATGEPPSTTPTLQLFDSPENNAGDFISADLGRLEISDSTKILHPTPDTTQFSCARNSGSIAGVRSAQSSTHGVCSLAANIASTTYPTKPHNNRAATAAENKKASFTNHSNGCELFIAEGQDKMAKERKPSVKK